MGFAYEFPAGFAAGFALVLSVAVGCGDRDEDPRDEPDGAVVSMDGGIDEDGGFETDAAGELDADARAAPHGASDSDTAPAVGGIVLKGSVAPAGGMQISRSYTLQGSIAPPPQAHTVVESRNYRVVLTPPTAEGDSP